MKIFITGGSGLLGQYLNRSLTEKHEIISSYKTAARNCTDYNSVQIDITDYAKTEETIKHFAPEILIHAAAVSTPAKTSELSSKAVYDTNVNATKHLAEICENLGIKLVYISTDLVYAGYRGSMLKEDSKIIPVSMYAETKLMGEVKIKETTDNYIILRTALLYGFGLNGKENHFHQMYNKLKKGEKASLFKDQYRTPVSLPEAARMIGELCGMNIKRETINLGGSERISRLELGKRLCKVSGFQDELLESISMNDLPDYPQVADVSLNTDKLCSYGIKQKTVDESLYEIINKQTGHIQ